MGGTTKVFLHKPYLSLKFALFESRQQVQCIDIKLRLVSIVAVARTLLSAKTASNMTTACIRSEKIHYPLDTRSTAVRFLNTRVIT